MEYISAFDVGGTRIKVAIVTTEGEVLKTYAIPSNASQGAEVLYETILSHLEESQKENDGKLVGIGLSLSGGIHPDKGVVLLPGKFKFLEDYPIVPKLREQFEIPVFADNDGRAATYFEKYYGDAQDVDWAVILTIGTGVGSGVILDGKILIDRNLMFGTQMGHLIMKKSSGRMCITGNRGTGETYCSATALANQVKNVLQRGVPSSLADAYFENPNSIDFKVIVDAVREGDKVAVREFDDWVSNLVILLVNAVHAYGPQRIVLSGGATLAADLFLDRLKKEVNEKVFRYPKDDEVEIVISQSEEYMGAIGIAAFMRLKMGLIN